MLALGARSAALRSWYRVICYDRGVIESTNYRFTEVKRFMAVVLLAKGSR